jgi:hypothetical protein
MNAKALELVEQFWSLMMTNNFRSVGLLMSEFGFLCATSVCSVVSVIMNALRTLPETDNACEELRELV